MEKKLNYLAITGIFTIMVLSIWCFHVWLSSSIKPCPTFKICPKCEECAECPKCTEHTECQKFTKCPTNEEKWPPLKSVTVKPENLVKFEDKDFGVQFLYPKEKWILDIDKSKAIDHKKRVAVITLTGEGDPDYLEHQNDPKKDLMEDCGYWNPKSSNMRIYIITKEQFANWLINISPKIRGLLTENVNDRRFISFTEIGFGDTLDSPGFFVEGGEYYYLFFPEYARSCAGFFTDEKYDKDSDELFSVLVDSFNINY